MTVWNLDISMGYRDEIHKICDQQKLEKFKLKYDNINYIKYYYGQIEIKTNDGNCDIIVEDLYAIYKCPMKISIEDEHVGLELSLMVQSSLPVNIGYHPSKEKYESNPEDSEDNSEREEDEYTRVDAIYNHWVLKRPKVEENEKVKKIFKILDDCCFSDVFSDEEENDYDYTSVDKKYKNWVYARPSLDDFECEESIRITNLLGGNNKCKCSLCV
jgi:hypothetical protein